MDITWKKIELEDKETIEKYFREEQPMNCEFTFANLYLWSRQYPTQYTVIFDTLVFLAMREGKEAVTFPCGHGDVKGAIHLLREHFQKTGKDFILYLVTEDKFALLEEWFPDTFEITYDRDVADYIYESEKLITLSGKKLHSKRNHINVFKSKNQWSYEPLKQENVEECFQMALKWRSKNCQEDEEDKMAEVCVTFNALRLFEELELIGGVLRIDGEVVAFTIGEAANKDTFVIHIEKAFAEIQGAYPMINQQFAQHELSAYKYINREEDTGSEGLRKSKLSYKPVFLIEKGIVKEKRKGSSGN
ncbi:MAG: DUF2156 domain-containing protein [Lachnospiraceae bacterium]|jgi:hypothetical protein|nr:DUF2156 domain-containing protein [Lachnospiraceae bacterium]